MKLLKSIQKYESKHSFGISIICILYILFDISLPKQVASLIDTSIGQILVYVLALIMFPAAGILAGVLALLAGYTLIQRASIASGNAYIYQENKAEEIKMQMLDKYNEYPKTLEEEVVATMAPIVQTGNQNFTFKPVLDDLQNAAPVDYEGVI